MFVVIGVSCLAHTIWKQVVVDSYPQANAEHTNQEYITRWFTKRNINSLRFDFRLHKHFVHFVDSFIKEIDLDNTRVFGWENTDLSKCLVLQKVILPSNTKRRVFFALFY